MKFSKQYPGYYAKYSLFNLKGSKSEVTKWNLGSSLCFSEGFFNFICYAEQYKQKVIQNKKCMKFTMGQASDSMTTMAYQFHRRVTAPDVRCLLLGQLWLNWGFSLALDCQLVENHFLYFITACLYICRIISLK